MGQNQVSSSINFWTHSCKLLDFTKLALVYILMHLRPMVLVDSPGLKEASRKIFRVLEKKRVSFKDLFAHLDYNGDGRELLSERRGERIQSFMLNFCYRTG